MSLKSITTMSAVVLLTCGLGLGTSLLSTAGAQQPTKNTETELRQLQKDFEEARQNELRERRMAVEKKKLSEQDNFTTSALQWLALNLREDHSATGSNQWEYDLLEVVVMDQSEFVKFLRDREARGFEFKGTTSVLRNGKKVDVWIFRKPEKNSLTSSWAQKYYSSAVDNFSANDGGKTTPKQQDVRAIEAQIERLQAQLLQLKKKQSRLTYMKETLPMEPAEFAEVIKKLALRKFKANTFNITATADGIAIEGDDQFRKWAAEIVKTLSER